MSIDRRYLVWALGYAAAGMSLGVVMGASHNHAQHVTHAHILLVGFVASFLYGVIHKLWLGECSPRLAKAQFLVHQAGAATLFISLLLLFGNTVPPERLDPILAAASLTVLAAALLMLFMVIRSGTNKP